MIINKINNGLRNFALSKKIKKATEKPKKDNGNLLLSALDALAVRSGLKLKTYKLSDIKFVNGVAYKGDEKFTGIVKDIKKNKFQIRYENGLPVESNVFDSKNKLNINKEYKYFDDDFKMIITNKNNSDIEKVFYEFDNSCFVLASYDNRIDKITQKTGFVKESNKMRRIYNDETISDTSKINNSWKKGI